jgi:hypothetical protein
MPSPPRPQSPRVARKLVPVLAVPAATVHLRHLGTAVHRQTLRLGPGWHTLALGSTAQEVATR